MSEVLEEILNFFSDGSLEEKISIKTCNSFLDETQRKVRIEVDESSSFIQEVIGQAEYSTENENINDSVGTIISNWFKKKRRLNVVQWKPNNDKYPRFMLLGTDKGILAYIEFFFHQSKKATDDVTVCRMGICHLMDDLKKRLPLVDSDLDRPTFYVHVLNYPCQKGIYFETTEMIKNNIFEKSDCIYNGKTRHLYFSNIDEMGDFEELVSMFEDLKKNNVKFF